jgi:acetyltransferase-like isoleucine patch superfamily enzyme
VEDGAELGSDVAVWHFCHVRSGARIGAGSSLGKSTYVDAGAVIGKRCRIQNFVSVYNGVTLEDEVFVGPSATFTNDLRPRVETADAGTWTLSPTLVRTGATIGAHATIVCGVSIGAHAFVAAGAVVAQDVEDHALVAGVPARPIGWVCWCGRRVPEKPAERCAECRDGQ